MAKKTPGIYIAIRGDVSAFEADLHRARQIAKAQGDAIAKSIGNAVSKADLTGGITKLTRELKTAQAALSAGAFKAQVFGLEDIAKAAGVSSKHLEGLTNSMLKSQAAATADRAFEYLQKNAGLSATALAKLRRELGDTEGALKTAMGALNARPRSVIVSEMKDIVAAYREVKNSADATANDVKRAAESMRGSLKKLASEARATKVAPTVELTPLQQALASVQRSGKLTTQEIDRLSAKAAQFAGKRDMEQALARIKREAGLSTAEMTKLRFQTGDTGGALSTLMSGAKAAAVPVLAVGAAFATVAKASFDATLKLDSTTAAFESITGGAKAAQEQLLFIRELSDKLGLSFLDTAQSAKTIFASAESTGLGMEKAQKAFQAVATAGTALKLTTDQMNRLNLAVSQVISKGRPMAEEMRQQIGEVLPGAMGLFATSIGVTGKELDKMFQDGKTTLEQFFTFLDALQDKYEEAAKNASHSLQAELGRLKTSWDDFLVAVGDSDTFASVTRGLSNALDTATGIIKESQLPKEVANLFQGVDIDVSGPTQAAAQIESEIARLIATVQKMPDPMRSAAQASHQLEDSIHSQSEALDDLLGDLPDESFFKRIFGTVNELTPLTQAAFDETRRLIEEMKKTGDFQNFRDHLIAIGKSLEEEGRMTVRFRGYLEKLQEAAARAVVIQLQLEGKEKVLQGLREVWQAQRLQNDPALATQKQWKADFDALIAGHREALEKKTRAATEAIETLDKLYEKSTEGKKEKIRSEIEAIEKGRVALEQAVKDGIRSQKELDDYNQKAASATKKLKEEQRKLDTTGSKSAEAAANRAATALAAYDAELAKLTKSSREVEKVKIDEKLRKIAKDAKLPTVEIEKLRVAMEQEANFKWMQSLLSYADPAAAAIAKVDREYQDFLRDVQSLKKEDPEKYTQLMAKAETEHEKALRKATRAGKEQTDHTQEKLAFYKELEELTGQYGLSLKYQNDLLAQQVELWRDADIPEDYINKMRELRELQMSRDWVDGAKRGLLEYRASASDTAKGVEESFKGLFDGMDSGWKSAWQQMIETGKVSLSSFRSLFASFLADLLHMAITRPITVQIAGVVSGMFGAGGVAQAAGGAGGGGGAGGLLGNIPFSSLLPSSWTSGGLFAGVAGTINGWGASAFPSLFAANSGQATVNAALNSMAGTSFATSTLLGTLGAAGVGFGLGSLAGSLLFPDRPGVSMGSGIGGGLGAAIGSIVPGIGTLLGGAVGSLFGGALGGIFGGRKPKRPAVWGGVEINLGDPEAYRDGSYDFGAAFDRKGYGRPEFEVTEGGYYAVASRDRNKAGAEASQAMNAYLKQVADAAVAQTQTLQNALPEAYASQFAAGLSRHTIKASYDLKGSEISEEKMREIAADLQAQVADAMFAAFKGMDFSEYAGRIDVDQSNIEGLTKFTQAVAVVDETLAATKELRDPTSEWVTAAKQAVAQMEAWQETMRSTGVTEDYAASLMEEYQSAYRDNFLKQLGEMFAPSLSEVERQAKSYREAIEGAAEALKLLGGSEEELAKVRGYTQTAIDNVISALESSLSPLSAYEQAQQNANAVIDQHIAALQQLGASEGEIARVEALRAEAVAQATAELLRSFEQNVAQRWAALDGASDEVGRAISQENELREAVQKFGEGSAQVAELLKLHAAETAKAAEEAAKAAQEAARSEYDALKSQMDALEQQRVQLRQQAIQEEISALNEQMNAAKTLRNTWEGLDKSLGQARYNLFAGAANLDAEKRLGTVQAEFRRLSGLAMGGDSEAAGQLAGVGNSLLDLVKQTAGTEEEYLDAFWAVNAQLRNAQDVAGAQVSSADKQLEALQGQLDVQNAALAQLQGQSATLEEIEKQIAELRPLLEAAGQKAGIKAFASGGLALPGWALVGEKGPELVNFSQPGRVYTAADTAALFRSATPRAADAGSSEEVRALREEVYQLRRDMNILLSEVAKYGRRVSDLVELWDVEGVPTKVGA